MVGPIRSPWDDVRVDRIGWAGVAVVAALVVAIGVAAVDARDRPDPVSLDDAVSSLVDAYARSRTETYRASGSFTRAAEDEPTRALSAAVEWVQRPPDRLIRQFGEVTGRRDDRLLACPAPIGDEAAECSLGPADESFDEAVAAEIDAFRSLVEGDAPLYEVRRRSAACWRMTRMRYDPRSGFGVEADLCVDEATGAVRSLRIDHGDIVEETVYDTITTEVDDADLEP